MTEIRPPARGSVPGDNVPDFAKTETDRLALDYDPLATSVAQLLAQAKAEIPAEVADDEGLAIVNRFVVKLRDMRGSVVAQHKPEKEPHLRRGEAVDQFFFGMRDRLLKAEKVTAARGDAYNQKRLADERRRREEERLRVEREAREAQRKLDEQARIAREAEEKARRARNAENIAAHQKVADEAKANVAGLKEEAVNASAQAQDAAAAALAKPAELTRHRTEDGLLSTMREKPHVEIVDVMKLCDSARLLWPFFKEEEILRALKKYAATTNHKRPVEGAIIEMRASTEYR